MRWGDGMKPLLAPDVLADGLMKVSIERGLYKQVDVGKVSAGAHYTEGDCWLQPPVDAFIRAQIHSKQLRHVLDPFAGSGTTLAVAKKLSREPVGFELSKQYFDQAAARLKAAKAGTALDGVEDPLTSAPKTGTPRNAPKRKTATKEDDLLFAV